MLKSFLLLFALALFGFAPASAVGAMAQHAARSHRAAASTNHAVPAQKPENTSAASSSANAHAQAKDLYQRDCSLCHGDSGNGQTDVAKGMNLTMPDWTNPQTLAGMQDSDLFDIIRKGKGQMPPEGAGRAKDAEVHGLILYIRTLSKGHTAPPPAPASAAPAPSNAEPAPTKAEPAPSNAEPAPTKAEPAPSNAEPAPTKAEPEPGK